MLRKSAKCTFSNRFLRVADSQKHVPYEIIQLIIMSTYPKIKISCGYSHTCLLMDEVYVWGHNDEGQLGLGAPRIFACGKNLEDIIKIRIRHRDLFINFYSLIKIVIFYLKTKLIFIIKDGN